MYEPPPGHETVLRTKLHKACMEARFVLTAVGIRSEAVHHEGWWHLVVSHAEAANAATELDAYHQENPDQPNEHSVSIPIYRGAAAGVLVYAAVILLLAMMTAQSALGRDWLAVGRMQAGSVTSGQWWRTVTALTLHLDAGHLVANLIFGGVFGLLAGRIFGGGVAWLAILIAGALGNFINAVVQPPAHTSIGASTAVFAALAMMVSHALRPRASVQEKRLRRWSPLIGGTLLLAFIGVGGPRTDVLAHATGFLAGLVIGWLGCRLPHHLLASSSVQQWAGIAALAIVTAAWVFGLVVVP